MVKLQRTARPEHGRAECSLWKSSEKYLVTHNSYCPHKSICLRPHPPYSLMTSEDSDQIEGHLRRRVGALDPLHLESDATNLRGSLPNTILAVVIIAFFLGGIFCVSFLKVTFGGFEKYWWFTRQLAFFLCAWSFFHWAEFAVTAGWNLGRCNIDCEPVF